MRFGVHVSAAGGLDKVLARAADLRLECMQIFTGSPRVWKHKAPDPVRAADFAAATRDAGISPVVLHAQYLINLASPDPALWHKSIDAMARQLEAADLLGAAGVVVHPGSRGMRGLQWGMERVADGVRRALRISGARAAVLLENTAGGGGQMGGSLAQLAAMTAMLADLSVGVCLDTAHAWAAGYHLEDAARVGRFLDKVERSVGLDAVGLWHCNDIALPRGARRDVHTHLGKGFIGLNGFKALVAEPRMARACLVMETPKDSRWADRRNMLFMRRLRREAARGAMPPN